MIESVFCIKLIKNIYTEWLTTPSECVHLLSELSFLCVGVSQCHYVFVSEKVLHKFTHLAGNTSFRKFILTTILLKMKGNVIVTVCSENWMMNWGKITEI